MASMATDILKTLKPEAAPKVGPTEAEKEGMANMAEGILKHLRPNNTTTMTIPPKNDAKEAAKKQLLGAASAVQNSA